LLLRRDTILLFQAMFGGYWCLIFLFVGVNKGDKTDCQLPRKWSGIWFLSGHPERIQINSRNLGWLGRCHQVHDDNKYVFYRAADNCFQCVAFWSRHENVLEFKSGECSVNDDPEHLCDISPDKTLNTLIRVDGDNIACPIPVPSMFSYDKGTGSCSSPLSDVSGCMSGSQVKLRYQPCPDILQTESKGWIATITIAKIYR